MALLMTPHVLNHSAQTPQPHHQTRTPTPSRPQGEAKKSRTNFAVIGVYSNIRRGETKFHDITLPVNAEKHHITERLPPEVFTVRKRWTGSLGRVATRRSSLHAPNTPSTAVPREPVGFGLVHNSHGTNIPK